MPDFTIEDLDSSHIRVRCEKHLAKELSDHFTFKVPGREFMPAYRQKRWDGQIKLYNLYSQKIYAGLEAYVYKFCEDRKYTLDLPKRGPNTIYSENDLQQLLKSLNITIGGKSDVKRFQ